MPKYQDIRLFLCALLTGGMLLSFGSESMAQTRHRGRPTPKPQVNANVLLDSLRLQYMDYRIKDTEPYLNQLTKVNPTDSTTEINLYVERIERAKRMLPKTETLPLLYKFYGDWEQITNLSHDIGSLLSIKVNEEGRIIWSSRVARPDFASDLISIGSPKDIDLIEYLPEKEDNRKIFEAINKISSDEDFPFLLSDGLRLIFGSNRPDGLGGYDLYMSRYNIERGMFLEPSLLPMPYNSPSNDYLLVCDEELGRTLLVSDRGCKEGEIVLFIFEGLPYFVTGEKIPEHSDDESTLRDKALLRLEPRLNDISLIQIKANASQPILLPLNGNIQIRALEDFQSIDAQTLYKSYLSVEDRLRDLRTLQRQIEADIRSGKRTMLEGKKHWTQIATEIRNLQKEQSQRLISIKNTEIKYRQNNL